MRQKGELKFLADLLIYKGDREFRLVSSTKRGKGRWLNITEIINIHCCGDGVFQQTIITENPKLTEKLFFDTLIYYINQNKVISSLLKCEWLINSNRLHQSIRTVNNASNKLARQQQEDRRRTGKKRKIKISSTVVAAAAGNQEEKQKGDQPQNNDDDILSTGPSYYENVNELWEKIACNIEEKEGLDEEGHTLTKMNYFADEGGYCVSFRSTSKYCEIKQNEHGKNHVYYVVWLLSKVYYQRCWNDDCIKNEARHLRKHYSRLSRSNENNNNDSEEDDDEIDINEEDPEKKTCRGITKYLDEELYKDINIFLENERQYFAEQDSGDNSEDLNEQEKEGEDKREGTIISSFSIDKNTTLEEKKRRKTNSNSFK